LATDLSSLDWEDVKSFRAVAVTGTLRTAAHQLGVHHTTVSRRVEALEKSLRTRLLERTPDGYVLTSPGEEILAAAEMFAAKLRDADRHIAGRDNRLEGELKITMPQPLALTVFTSHLAEFSRRYPGLDLIIHTGVEFLDLSRREADIAIRLENEPAEDLVGKRLFPYYETAYASPDYLANHDPIAAPENARWLGWRLEVSPFPDWVTASEFPQTPAWGCFSDVMVQCAAARQGLGIAMLPCLVGDADKGLVRAGRKPPTPARDIWLLTHSDLRRVARVRAFMKFAEQILREAQARITGIETRRA